MVSILLHLAVGYVIAVSGLVAPFWAVGLLVAIWGFLIGQLVSITRRRRSPWWYLAVPGAAALAWLLVVPGLGALFGWTA